VAISIGGTQRVEPFPQIYLKANVVRPDSDDVVFYAKDSPNTATNGGFSCFNILFWFVVRLITTRGTKFLPMACRKHINDSALRCSTPTGPPSIPLLTHSESKKKQQHVGNPHLPIKT
jgi:hypothetical protein